MTEPAPLCVACWPRLVPATLVSADRQPRCRDCEAKHKPCGVPAHARKPA